MILKTSLILFTVYLNFPALPQIVSLFSYDAHGKDLLLNSVVAGEM